MDEPTTPTSDLEQPVVAAPGQEAASETGQTTEESFFDPKGLSEELMPAYKQMQAAFTKKTQDIADVRKKAEALDQLSSYSPFVNWYNQHKNGTDRRPIQREELPKNQESDSLKQPQELSPEDFAMLQQDPKKFAEYIKQVSVQASAPMVKEAQEKAEFAVNLNKVESFAKEHPDFWDLDTKGLIEPLIEKYPGMELDDVYKLAKFPFLEEDAIRKAHSIVQDKRNAVTEKPGSISPGRTKTKVKSREEAMALAWDAASKGEEVPEFDWTK